MAFKLGAHAVDTEAETAERHRRLRDLASPHRLAARSYRVTDLLHGLPHEGYTLHLADGAGKRAVVSTRYWTDAERAALLEDPDVAAAIADGEATVTLGLRGKQEQRHFQAQFADVEPG